MVTNAAPTAAADSDTVVENASVIITVLSNDSDTDGTLDVTSVEIEAADDATGKVKTVTGEGVWTVNADGTITFAPETGYTGAVTDIAYTVADNLGARSAPAAVSVTITPANTAPVLTDPGAVVVGPGKRHRPGRRHGRDR